MAALNTTTFSYALKRLYTKKKIQNMVYQDNPFLAMVKKDENFGGSNFTEAVIYGDVAGRSATFADAQANKAGSLGKAFLITRVKDYSLASIDSETILASQGSERALLSAVKREMDAAVNALRRSMGVSIYRDGSGSIGTISGAPATNVVTLASADDITNFEVGMQVERAPDTTTAPSDVQVIEAVDRDAGTFTLDDDTNWADGDLIFVEGDKVGGTDVLKMAGLSAWLPAAAPTSTAFFGVDRSSDVTRLGGIRVTGTSLGIEEALKKAAMQVAREGGRPDCVFLSFEQYDALTNILGSKVQYTSHKVGEVGFEGVKVIGPKGIMEVYPDQNCPGNVAYVLTKDAWTLRSLGAAPRILDLDGQKWLRESSADALEVRLAFFGNLACNAPGWNARVSLDPVV